MPDMTDMIAVTLTFEVVIDPRKWREEFADIMPTTSDVARDVASYFFEDEARTVRPIADDELGPSPFPPGMHGTTEGGVVRRTATVGVVRRPVSAW